jgi:hypothetical protein
MHEAAWTLEAKAERFERSPFRVPGEAPFEFQIARWPCICLQDLELTVRHWAADGASFEICTTDFNSSRVAGYHARKERRIEGTCCCCLPGQARPLAKHMANHTS